MKQIDWKRLTKRRMLGFVMIALGLIVLFMPVFVGGWILSLLGGVLVLVGLFHFVETVRSREKTTSRLSYVAGVVATLLGVVMFLSPNLALSALLVAVTLFLVGSGGVRIYGAVKQSGQERWWSLFNGLFTIALGLLIWYLFRVSLGIAAIGVSLGLWLLVEGWTLVFLPEKNINTAKAIPTISNIKEMKCPFMFEVANFI